MFLLKTFTSLLYYCQELILLFSGGLKIIKLLQISLVLFKFIKIKSNGVGLG